MSADNAIIILKTPGEWGFEYRVAHVCAAENLTYEHSDGNPEYVNMLFWDAIVFQKHTDALVYALELERFYGFIEYGVYDLEFPHPFQYYVERAPKH